MSDKTVKIRIDKWLWAVRIFKTRTMAAEACSKGRVLINGMEAKPSREVRVGDTVVVRKPPVLYTYRVLGIIDRRQPASKVKEYLEDITSPEELQKLKIKDTFFIRRDPGSGRPTKKERRLLDKLMNNFNDL